MFARDALIHFSILIQFEYLNLFLLVLVLILIPEHIWENISVVGFISKVTWYFSKPHCT